MEPWVNPSNAGLRVSGGCLIFASVELESVLEEEASFFKLEIGLEFAVFGVEHVG